MVKGLTLAPCGLIIERTGAATITFPSAAYRTGFAALPSHPSAGDFGVRRGAFRGDSPCHCLILIFRMPLGVSGRGPLPYDAIIAPHLVPNVAP